MWKKIFKNWKTTAAGALTIASVVVPAATAPGNRTANLLAILNDPAKLAAVTTGVGLIVSKDFDANAKTEDAETPKS